MWEFIWKICLNFVFCKILKKQVLFLLEDYLEEGGFLDC